MLYTAQISNIKRLANNIEVIDITAKSSVTPWDTFAPTWVLVQKFKEGSMNEQDYRNNYLRLMRSQYKKEKAIFNMLINKALSADVALACYCTAGTFCHRTILAEILTKIEPKLIFKGEILPAQEEQITLFG